MAKYYCDCINLECPVWQELLEFDDPCPECGADLESCQVEDWN
jgi:hypothetical protein